MKDPRPIYLSGPKRKSVDRFSDTWMPSTMKQNKFRNKKSDLDNPQRSWRIRRISQKALLWMLLPVVVLSVAWLGYVMLLRSDIFRMTTVTVKGNQVLNQQQVLNRAGIRPGINLLAMDIAQLEASIRQEKWIEQVWIKRHWPSTLEIIIREYKPFALMNLESNGNKQLYYVNRNGVVFAPSTTKKDLDYPVINGKFPAAKMVGNKLPTHSLGSMALEFLRLTDRGNQILPTQAISEIKVDPEEGLVVYLVDYPFPIYMGNDKIRVRFSRLVKVLAKLYKEDRIKGIAEIRMDYAENKILVSRVGEA